MVVLATTRYILDVMTLIERRKPNDVFNKMNQRTSLKCPSNYHLVSRCIVKDVRKRYWWYLILTKADVISAVEFDHTGDYLATGDRGGRVVLFERNDGVEIILT